LNQLHKLKSYFFIYFTTTWISQQAYSLEVFWKEIRYSCIISHLYLACYAFRSAILLDLLRWQYLVKRTMSAALIYAVFSIFLTNPLP
jgi:hypothetical protein